MGDRPIHTPRVGIISTPRPVKLGVKFILPHERRANEWLAGGTAIHDGRWAYDDDALRMGFTGKPRG